MSEKENQHSTDILLNKTYELTKNKWNRVSLIDLKRALIYRIEEDVNSRRNWIRYESKDEQRQLEVIHLLLLVKKIDNMNIKNCITQLQTLEPDDSNKIQPLYIPNNTEEEQEILDIKLNSGSHMIVKENSFLFKPPIEI